MNGAATDRQRMARAGLTAMSAEEGLALFDAALAAPTPVILPMRLDLAAVQRRINSRCCLLRANSSNASRTRSRSSSASGVVRSAPSRASVACGRRASACR